LLHGRRSAAAAGKCGQCHVVSARRTLNTNLFLVDKEPALLQAPYLKGRERRGGEGRVRGQEG